MTSAVLSAEKKELHVAEEAGLDKASFGSIIRAESRYPPAGANAKSILRGELSTLNYFQGCCQCKMAGDSSF
ncbi:hypothetical protein BaRGS_00026532 [Batillaria attramentaria]|uniref:Uncharacterized protein n=1 Tax=Batillaria attramentaria TaxID=370345 RepID=A0ABD0K5D0_9CAEN